MKTNAWKRFIRGAGQALANGLLTTDPMTYSYYLMCTAERKRPVAFVASTVAIPALGTTEASPADLHEVAASMQLAKPRPA
jgi:hypothetical protein